MGFSHDDSDSIRYDFVRILYEIIYGIDFIIDK